MVRPCAKLKTTLKDTFWNWGLKKMWLNKYPKFVPKNPSTLMAQSAVFPTWVRVSRRWWRRCGTCRGSSAPSSSPGRCSSSTPSARQTELSLQKKNSLLIFLDYKISLLCRECVSKNSLKLSHKRKIIKCFLTTFGLLSCPNYQILKITKQCSFPQILFLYKK